MLELSPLLLAEWQFFGSLGFLSIFVSVLLTSGWMLLFLKLAWRRTGQEAWIGVYRYWVRVFALAMMVSMAVIVSLMIQVGTLWPALLMKIAGVAGPLACLAVLLAFACKLIFLNGMLYRQGKMKEGWHTASVFMSALSVTAIVYLVLALQSWMNAPQGTIKTESNIVVYDWMAIVFHHEIVWRLLLVFAGSSLSMGFMMMGVSAWQARQRPLSRAENLSFRIGLVMALYGFVVFIVPGFFAQDTLFVAFSTDGWRSVWWGVILLLGMMMSVLAVSCYYLLGKKREIGKTPVFLQKWCSGMTFSGWLLVLLMTLLSYVRNLPFIVQGEIALQEVFRPIGTQALVLSSVMYLVVYLVIVASFIQMFYQAARYGVVPVRKTVGAAA